MSLNSINTIIKQLELEPHPEGGYFKETYRSNGLINADSLNGDYQGNRNYSTCIYFLLTSDNFSALHRIKQDEIWHFYEGSTISLYTISPSGAYEKILIGNKLGQVMVRPQFIVLMSCIR